MLSGGSQQNIDPPTDIAAEPLEALLAASTRAEVFAAVVDAARWFVPTDGVRVAELRYGREAAYRVVAHNSVGPDPSAAIAANPLAHPIVVEYIRSRFAGLVSMADLLPGRQWLNHPLYCDVYRPVGLKSQISCALIDSDMVMHSLSLNRAGVDFSEKERSRLLQFRGLVRATLARVDRTASIERALGALEEALAGGQGRVMLMSPDGATVIYASGGFRAALDVDPLLAAAVQQAIATSDFPLMRVIHSGAERHVLRAHRTSDGVIAVLEQSADNDLTAQESRVLRAMSTGRTAHALARELGVSVRTVNKHVEHIYRKLGVHDRVSAVLAAQSAGII